MSNTNATRRKYQSKKYLDFLKFEIRPGIFNMHRLLKSDEFLNRYALHHVSRDSIFSWVAAPAKDL